MKMAGKRVARACDRCRLKKSKCNGAAPCDRCSSADLICEFIQRPRPKRVYPSGYAEMLEEQQRLLINGLRTLYSHIQNGQRWPYRPLESKDGRPLVHDILKSMGVLKANLAKSSNHISSGLHLYGQRSSILSLNSASSSSDQAASEYSTGSEIDSQEILNETPVDTLHFASSFGPRSIPYTTAANMRSTVFIPDSSQFSQAEQAGLYPPFMPEMQQAPLAFPPLQCPSMNAEGAVRPKSTDADENMNVDSTSTEQLLDHVLSTLPLSVESGWPSGYFHDHTISGHLCFRQYDATWCLYYYI